MHTAVDVRRVAYVCRGTRVDLPEEPGVYAFWWLKDRSILLGANGEIVFKGPGGTRVEVEYKDWWPRDLVYPCLYVGQSTNLKKRFALHIMRGIPGRLHPPHPEYVKATPRTTSCQLRWGIEHVFPEASDSLDLIFQSVGFSFRTDFGEDAIVERFFEEERLIGLWRPWFNIDCER